MRARLPEVLPHLVEVLGERRGQPVGDAEERLEPRERVRERQEQEVHPPLLNRGRLLGGGHRGGVIAGWLHDSPWRAGGGRGGGGRRHDGGAGGGGAGGGAALLGCG